MIDPNEVDEEGGGVVGRTRHKDLLSTYTKLI